MTLPLGLPWAARLAPASEAPYAPASECSVGWVVAWIGRDLIVIVAWAARMAEDVADLVFVAARTGEGAGDGSAAAVEAASAPSLVGRAVVP